MLITKVELENIKSYRRASIELRHGTTAIRGQNGAGKTTLVEAIGFALFDYLPYSQAQFVREGERSGTVTVSFVASDDRLYQVVRRCGTPSAWYVFDPQLDKRLVEQKTDVIDWLREHLPLQGELELAAFFSDALGVQQGTFTSDFLAAPAKRKSKFDALLQVEEYRKAAEKLLDTRNHLLHTTKEVELQIQRLEAETAAIGTWRGELAGIQSEHASDTQRLLAMSEAHEQIEAVLTALRQMRDDLNLLEKEREQAENGWRLAQQALNLADADLAEALAAQRILEESSEDYRAYLQAETDLQAARQQQQSQQVLKDRLAVQRQELAKARRDEDHAAQQLAEAQAARQKMEELAPKVAEQAALEQQIQEARQHIQRLRELEQDLARLEAGCARLTEDIEQQATRIAAIEALRPVAALRDERQAEVNRLNLEIQRRDDWNRELKQVRQSLQEAQAQRAKTGAEVEKHQANVAKLLATRPLVETLPTLEAEWNEARQQVIVLQGNIKRHRESKLQSVGGHCPFLQEPCLNIQQKGLSSLETYFDGLIARDQIALAPLEVRQAELEQQVQDVRIKKTYVDRLDDYEQSLRDAQERQEHARQEAERLATREHELLALLTAAGESAQRLPEAQRLLQQSDEADKEVRKLEGLLSQQESQQRQLESQQQQLETLRAQRAALADAPAREQTASRLLNDLNDPRRTYNQQESIAKNEQKAQLLLDSARQLAAQAEKIIASLDMQLAPYADLDERISRLTHQQDQSRPGYQTYLAHQHMAAKAPERQAIYDIRQSTEREAKERYVLAQRNYAEKSAGFDPQALAAAEQEERQLHDGIVFLRERLRALNDKMQQREQDIAAAELKQIELEAARAEYQELKETQETLQQFRETIKEAGPSVMKELLRQISTQANRIFGEILGDRSAELSWEEDYEIILRSRGQERSFAQLSGGEQMSAALAVRLALLKTLAKLDVAFFDEPTQNMDEMRRGNLAEQIRRVRGFNQLIVISHDDTFEQGLDSVILLSKRDGETVVDEGDLALAGSTVTSFDGVGYSSTELDSASE
jgi:exonuclease SbcC